MADQEINIKSWPNQPARLSHLFESERPCPVAIHFEKDPANVNLRTSVEDPIHVDMGMQLSADKPLPICIRVCDPIAIESEYVINVQIFDRPVATITLRGRTRLFQDNEA